MERFQIVPALLPREIPAVAAPVERCVCCWPHAHPGQPYPAAWSSTLCVVHAAWYEEQRQARKRARHA